MSFEPEIKNDELYYAIIECVVKYRPRIIVEIGSANGLGSTQAFVEGIKEIGQSDDVRMHCVEIDKERYAELIKNAGSLNPFVTCHCGTTGAASDYMPDETIRDMMRSDIPMIAKKFRPQEVLGWKRDELEKVKDSTMVRLPINADMVLLDGSPFTGVADLRLFNKPQIIILDDTIDLKNWDNYQSLLKNPEYELIKENKELRNGYAIFCRRS
jgi:hypothetical protein